MKPAILIVIGILGGSDDDDPHPGSDLLLEDGTSFFLLEDGSSTLLLEG